MDDWAVSTDELQALSEIANELAVAEYSAALDDVVAKIAALVPLQLCVILHERGRSDGSMRVRAELFDPWPRRARRQVPEASCWNIARYLEHFQKVESFQNAFLWCAAPQCAGSADQAIVRWMGQTRLTRGVAGTASSSDGRRGNVTTLLQLQCEAERFAAKQLFFISIVVFHLHVHLINAAPSLPAANGRSALTCKEHQVLQWVVEGKTSWEVGRILSVSERTVKFHLRNIYAKLNVANRAQAVTIASRLRLI